MSEFIVLIIVGFIATCYVYSQTNNVLNGKIDPFQIFWAVICVLIFIVLLGNFLEKLINRNKKAK